MKIIQRLYRDTNGATMVEYGLMLTFIAIAVVASVNTLGVSVSNTFAIANGWLTP